VCFPLGESSYPNQEPFYFGIDCRTEEERRLGHFPKAYVADPSFITDTDAVASLLEILEPLARSVHLCIIGAGEEFIKYTYRKSPAAQRERILRNNRSQLNSIAMFFIKKSFRHVSILQGGFTAACRYLLRPESTLTLSAALVDCSLRGIEAVLGIKQQNDAAAVTVAPVSVNGEGLLGGLATVSNFFSGSASGKIAKESVSGGGGGGGGGSSGGSSSPRKVEVADGGSAEGMDSAGSQPTTGSHSAPAGGGTGAKQILSDFGKNVSMFGSSTKQWFNSATKGDDGTSASANANASSSATKDKESENKDSAKPAAGKSSLLGGFSALSSAAMGAVASATASASGSAASMAANIGNSVSSPGKDANAVPERDMFVIDDEEDDEEPVDPAAGSHICISSLYLHGSQPPSLTDALVAYGSCSVYFLTYPHRLHCHSLTH
jgi:hypothetical protein